MRVLQLMAGARHGGAETFFVDLIAALAKRGVEQLAVTRPFPERVTRLTEAGCQTETARFGPPFDLWTRFKVAGIARRYQPDIALVWMNRAASFAPRGRNVVVGRLGGYYDLKYYRQCDALICNTADIRAFTIAGGWPSDRVYHVPNFSPAPVVAPAKREESATPNGARVALILARLERSKGIDVAIHAVARLTNTILWIAGEGTERASLERVAISAGVSDRVRFLGWRDDRSALLRAADVCVVASREEPFGNVVVNAWAHGVPLVATRAKGPAALVRDGTDGLLVPVDDSAAMAQALARVLDDRLFAQRLIDLGATRVRSEFSEDSVVSRYLAVFDEVRHRRRGDLPSREAGA